MKVVMLNDYPWAVAPDDADEDELRKLGEEEARRLGWTPYTDYRPGVTLFEPGFSSRRIVHVHVKDAVDISDKLGKKKPSGKA